jgi:cell division initiation protein
MSLTPVEIRHLKPRRGLFGYERDTVDGLLEEIAASFENVWRERADLRDEVEDLESELARHREIESALRSTLLSAERMADDVRAQAHREAEVIIAEARARARDVTGGAEMERERIAADVRRLRTLQADLRAEYRGFLHAALERLDADTEPRQASGQAA